MLTNSVGQEFQQATVGMACLCSRMPGRIEVLVTAGVWDLLEVSPSHVQQWVLLLAGPQLVLLTTALSWGLSA